MENGHDRELAEKISGLAINDDSLFQIMKAVEAAEITIKQQKVESGSNSNAPANEAAYTNFNGTWNALPPAYLPDDKLDSHLSLFSTPLSAIPFSPTRQQLDGEYDSRLPQGLLPMPQDVTLKGLEQEEELLLLRKQLADFSVKEAQIRNEKNSLEKRISFLRLAFDQQQQDLVDAASKALSYRQDIIEENIRLAYQLQAAQEERTTFISYLLPLLAEYSLQPPVPDAQSIVSNVKVLFKHLREKLIVIESKLKESQYQLAPLRSDVNYPNFAPQSPLYNLDATLPTSGKNGLELVAQPIYSQGNFEAQKDSKWDLPGQHQGDLGGGIASKNLEPDDLGRHSPIASRTSTPNEIPMQLAVTHGDMHPMRYGEETTNKQVTFCDPVSGEMDYPDVEGIQNEREPPSNWGTGNSPYGAAVYDPSSSYPDPPYLTPVPEEPSSSFSEAAEDDPLPAIEGLQISGEAYPGRELQACGYSVNGTTSCNFEWVRHMEDGSVNYINGAKQPNYLVTADDVDTYLAIEVQPLDSRNRKVA